MGCGLEVTPNMSLNGIKFSTGNVSLSGLTSNQGLPASYVLTKELSVQVFLSHSWKTNLGFRNRGVSNLHGSEVLQETAATRDCRSPGYRPGRRLGTDRLAASKATSTGYAVGAKVSGYEPERDQVPKSCQEVSQPTQVEDPVFEARALPQRQPGTGAKR